MSDFVESALAELRGVQAKGAVDTIEVKQLIAESRKQTRIFKYGSVEIEIYASIPKSIPKLLAKMESAVKNEELTPEEMVSLEEYFSYTFMSQMCVNDPHNTMEFWFAFDAETGVVSKMSKDIMVQASETKDKIIEFRKK